MCQEHPAAIQFGVPRSEPETGRVGGDTTCGNTYRHLPRSWQYYKRIRKLNVHLSPLFLCSYTSFQLANLYIPRCGRWASRSLHDRFFPASRDRKLPAIPIEKDSWSRRGQSAIAFARRGKCGRTPRSHRDSILCPVDEIECCGNAPLDRCGTNTPGRCWWSSGCLGRRRGRNRRK